MKKDNIDLKKERKRASDRKYYYSHLEQRREYQIFWRECHPFYQNLWQQNKRKS
ncbi:MAG TPA: hypothetical protein VGB37_14010 [Candidatus Lokiarchaeia archaeon]